MQYIEGQMTQCKKHIWERQDVGRYTRGMGIVSMKARCNCLAVQITQISGHPLGNLEDQKTTVTIVEQK